MSAEELAGLGLDERVGMGGRDRGVSLVVPEDYMPGRTISVATPDGEMGEVELPKDAKPGQTVNLTMKKFDASGDEVVELVRPTPETKLGLTFGEFCGQVVIHQVCRAAPATRPPAPPCSFSAAWPTPGPRAPLGASLTSPRLSRRPASQVFPGYPAEKLKAGDFVHAINGTPVTAEKTATHIASKTGDRLLLKLRAPPGSTAVEFEKPDPDTEVSRARLSAAPRSRGRLP